jgi:hypothetical protein
LTFIPGRTSKRIRRLRRVSRSADGPFPLQSVTDNY